MRPAGRRLAALVVVALMGLSWAATTASAQSDCTPTAKQLQRGEHQVLFYLRAKSTTADPFLTTDVNATTAATYLPPGPTGPQRFVGALTGAPPTVAEFSLPGGVAAPLYLNLSRNVGMTLILKADIPAVQFQVVQVAHASVRVEILVGETLVGGQETLAVIDTVGNASASGCFRPETDVIPAGQPIKVRVLVDGGVQPLSVVTGAAGTGASRFAFTYFERDPLASLVYVQKGKLVLVDGGDQAEPAASSEDSSEPNYASPFAGFIPALAPLALRAGRGRRNVVLALLVVALAGQAGCVSSPSGQAPDSSESPSDSKQAPQISYAPLPPEEQDNGTGAIEGTVVDGTVDGIRAVPGALVVLAGSKQSARSDALGGFRFEGIYPGTFTLHIEAGGFETEELQVEVVANNLTRLRISLYPPGYDSTSANKIHKHPNWPPSGKITIFSDSFLPAALANSYMPVRWGDEWVCSWMGGPPTTVAHCAFWIPGTQKNPIPPGTGRIQAVLTWSGSQAPQELGLGVYTAAGSGGRFLPRASGEPFNVPIFPNEADPGHQNFSRWWFGVQTPYYAGNHPHSPFVYKGGEIGVEIVAYKGVVPFEPPHPDFWEDNQTYLVVNDKIISSSIGACQTGVLSLAYCGDLPREGFGWRPTFIPPGTLEIRGRFSWSNLNSAASVPAEWGLSYRPNGVTPWRTAELGAFTTEGTWRVAPFTIRLQDHETDQYYQTATDWWFSLEDHSDKGVHTAVSPGSSNFKLNATVIRNPGYVDL